MLRFPVDFRAGKGVRGIRNLDDSEIWPRDPSRITPMKVLLLFLIRTREPGSRVLQSTFLQVDALMLFSWV